MLRFSANLGFLWTDRPLPDAVAAAAHAGFDAVELHWPYATDAGELRTALETAGLPCLSLNTAKGNSFGLSALPDRTAARAAMAEACAYAAALGAGHVHVMAGVAEGLEAEQAFADTLSYALDLAHTHDLTLLLEPMNPHEVQGYFLRDIAQTRAVIARMGDPRLKLMFDCYHAGRRGEDVCAALRAAGPDLGHVQIAAVPDRGSPDHGSVDYAAVFDTLLDMGWTRPIGAEYRPSGPTENSLGWLTSYRDSRQ